MTLAVSCRKPFSYNGSAEEALFCRFRVRMSAGPSFIGVMETCAVNSETTQSLVERSQAGDRSAFDFLIERHRSDLQAALLSSVDPQLRDILGVDELTQEATVSAFTSLGRFEWRGEGSFAGWLRQIARNVVLAAIRKSRRYSTLEIAREPSGGIPTPSRAARREERFDRLETAFDRLSADHREVLRLSRLEGLGFTQIGERMGRSPDAVRKLFGRALAELRRSFGNTESLHLPDRALGDRDDG